MKKTIYSTICADDTFNEWTVLDRPVEDIGYSKKVWCRCSCGTEKAVEVRSLQRGSSKNCGCKQRNQNAERHAKNIGLRFGKLEIVAYGGKSHANQYQCHCDCGNTIYAAWKDLVCGKKTSCGCIKTNTTQLDANTNKVNGLETVKAVLAENGISFERNVSFSDCAEKGNPIAFDFGIYNSSGKLLGFITYGGAVHYSSCGTGWDTPERLIVIPRRDYIQQLYCENQRIPLLVIPYTISDIKEFLITSDFWNIITKNFND